MCACVCECGFREQHFCCQAYRKWVIQIGLTKWIFIETVAGHFVVVFATSVIVDDVVLNCEHTVFANFSPGLLVSFLFFFCF